MKQTECLTAWGPGASSRTPVGSRGEVRGGGLGGKLGGNSPRSSWVLAFFEGLGGLSLNHFL